MLQFKNKHTRSMLSYSMSKQTNCSYYIGYLLLFMLWGYKPFPVREVQSMFGRFMEGIKTMHFHGRCVPQSLVTFYFDVPDPNSTFSLIGRNTS